MTSNPPPNGMARAYLCPVTHRVWRWNGGMYGADDYAATAAEVHARRGLLTSIPEWSAANWDEPPEYVMAPPFYSEDWHKSIASAMETHAESKRLHPGRPRLWERALYRRHPDHPEVLRRVWVRDDAPSHVEKCAQPVPADNSLASRVKLPPGWAFNTCIIEGDGWLASAYHGLGSDMLCAVGGGETPLEAKEKVVEAAWAYQPVPLSSVERPAPTPQWELAGNEETKENHADLAPKALDTPDIRAIMQDQARRRDLFDGLRMAYQTGAEPVAMSPEFFEALERQRGKR